MAAESSALRRIPSCRPCSGPMAFWPPSPRFNVSSVVSAPNPCGRYVRSVEASSSGWATMNTTRVTTRACWIASSVSARVWPRPGATGSCCAASGSATSNARTASLSQRFIIQFLRRFLGPSSGRFSGRGKRPQAPVTRLDHISKDAQGDYSDSAEGKFPSRVIKQRRPAQDRQHGWPRIEPHLKGKPFRRPAAAQNHHAYALADELHQNAHGDNRLDDARKAEQHAEREGRGAEEKQRDVRKMFGGVHAGKYRKEITILGRGEWNS